VQFFFSINRRAGCISRIQYQKTTLGESVSSFSSTTSDATRLTSVPANPSVAMDAPPTYSAHAIVQSPFADTETITEKPNTRSTLTSTADKEPFTVGIVMERVSPASIDSKGKLQPQKVLKVKVSSIQIHADMTAEEFTRQNWDCFNENFGLHGWKKARRTKGEKSAGATYYPDEAWVRKIADMVADHEAGMDPVYCVTFSFTKGQRVKWENESELSFSLKKLLDRVLLRGRR
jgi:hypothetical protein